MKNLNLSILFFLITTHLLAQETSVGRIIAMKGDISIDATPAKNGQEILERNVDIIITGDDSYVTILSAEGDLRTFKKGRLKARYLVSSMRTRIPSPSNIGCPNPMAWVTRGKGHMENILGDSILLRWKTRNKSSFEIQLASIFGDSLLTLTTGLDSIYLNVGPFFEKEQNITITVSAGENYRTDILGLKRLEPQKLALVKHELSEITGAPADQKVIRLALLIKHEFYMDYFYEKSLLTPEEIAALSPDTKKFILADIRKFL